MFRQKTRFRARLLNLAEKINRTEKRKNRTIRRNNVPEMGTKEVYHIS